MRSYPQPEGEEVSDAQDGQEGTSEPPPLKREKEKGGGGVGVGETKEQERALC